MADKLVKQCHTYGGSALTINKDALGHRLNDIMSVVIHPYTHRSTIIECKGYFICIILNGEIIDLIGMIYKTNISHSTSRTLSYLYYPSLITRWVDSLLIGISFSV